MGSLHLRATAHVSVAIPWVSDAHSRQHRASWELFFLRDTLEAWLGLSSGRFLFCSVVPGCVSSSILLLSIFADWGSFLASMCLS